MLYQFGHISNENHIELNLIKVKIIKLIILYLNLNIQGTERVLCVNERETKLVLHVSNYSLCNQKFEFQWNRASFVCTLIIMLALIRVLWTNEYVHILCFNVVSWQISNENQAIFTISTHSELLTSELMGTTKNFLCSWLNSIWWKSSLWKRYPSVCQ